MDRQGPSIDHYATQQQYLSRQTAGGMEFRDCQNPDASDGYIVGPNEKVSLSAAAVREGWRKTAAFLGRGSSMACACGRAARTCSLALCLLRAGARLRP